MKQHDILLWLVALGPFFSGLCIGACTIAAALVSRKGFRG